jgi:hypothetical protein
MSVLKIKHVILIFVLTFPGFLEGAAEKSTEKKTVTSKSAPISDGISARKNGMHIRVQSESEGSNSSVKVENTPLATPRSGRGSESSRASVSGHRYSRFESQKLKEWMHIDSDEATTRRFLVELGQKNSESIGNILVDCLSKTALCALLPTITRHATTEIQGKVEHARLLNDSDKKAVAIAYFNVACASTRNDPKGGKEIRKSYVSEAGIVERVKKAKLVKPEDLKVFKDMAAAEKAQAKNKKIYVDELKEK